MSNGKRRYFPGANTGRGFIGHFEGIVPPWSEPHYTYVLKGGPGVGKSTLMKKCAAIARANGFTVEEFRCASDPESFDAVRIPQRRLVLLDGTAPHTIDPAMPGIDGETLDLGRFLHKEVFKRRREELFVLAEENRGRYRRHPEACRRQHGRYALRTRTQGHTGRNRIPHPGDAYGHRPEEQGRRR